MQCFLDLDGVLVDFVGGALKLHGRPDFPRKDIIWDFNEQLNLSPQAFWRNMGFDFWHGLLWTTEGRAILQIAKHYFGDANIAILTSPSKTPGCLDGKLSWIKNNIPEFSRQFFIGPAKHLLASPGKLLIDDCDNNTEKFEDCGGKVLLVPRPWNKLRHLTVNGDCNIDDLRKSLDTVLGI